MTKSLRRKRQSKEAIECSEDQQPPIKLAKDEANTASVIADGIDHDKGLPTDPGLSTLSQADSVDHVHVNVAVDVCITECNSKAQVNHVTLGQSHRDSGVDGVHDNDTKLETTIVTTTNEDITDGQNMNMSENSSSQILKTCESIYMKPSNQILNSTDNTTEININEEQKQHSNDVFEHDQKHEDIPKLLPCNKNNKDFDVGDCKGSVIVNAHSLDNLGNLHEEDCPLKDSSQKGNVVVENHQENSLHICEKDSLQIEHSTGNDDKVACKSVGYDKDKVVCPTIKTDAMITSNIASQRLNRITESQESSLVLDNVSITNEKTKSNDSIAEVTSTPTTVGRPGSSSSGGLEWDLKGSPLPNMTYNPISADLKPMMVTVNDQLKFPSHSSSSVSSYLTDMEVNGTQPFCATVTAETNGVVGCAVQTPDPIFKSPKLASEVKTAIKEAAVLPVLGARHHNQGDLAASHHHPVDDFDITDSELRSIGDAISETALRLPQSVPRPSSSVHDPEHVSEGSRIIKTIITEMAQLNKFVMRARRQIEATRKSRQRPPSTTPANTTVQTTSTGWKKF